MMLLHLHQLMVSKYSQVPRIPNHSQNILYNYFYLTGFVEATKGCCGTGRIELTSLLCNPKSIGTCSNATQYVFWDSVHPSEAANQILADSLLIEGINLIS